MSHTELVRLGPRPVTLWDRMKRAISLGPFSLKDKKLAEVMAQWSGSSTLSGVTVNEYSALTSSAVYSAVSMVSDDIASLPLFLYQRRGDGGKTRYDTHPLYRLLHDSPNPEMDSMVWRRTMQAHLMLWNNAYAEIERDQAGRPVAIWPLVPERVSVERRGGVLQYRVSSEGGGDVMIPAADMIHLVDQSHDGTVGNARVQKARESIALGLAAEKFGASFFGNGSTFGGVLSFPGPRPTEMGDKDYKDSLSARHQGVERAYRLLSIYNGASYERMGVPPNEGQFNETRIFQIREVARWFKIPPHKLGDLADATFSNVEQMDAVYLSTCIRPYLVLWQQQLSRKLIAPLERRIQFIEHDTHGFLSVDAAGRSALYSAEFNVGGITPNELRGYENRDPVEGGNRAFVQLNMMPLDKVDAYWDAQIAKLAAPPPAPPAPPPPQDGGRAVQEVARLSEERGQIEEARRQAEQRAEDLSAANTALENARDAALVAHADAAAALAVMQAEATDWARQAGEHAEAARALRSESLGLRLEQQRLEAAVVAEQAALVAAEAEVTRATMELATRADEYERVRADLLTVIQERDEANTNAVLAAGDRSAAVRRAEEAEHEKAVAEQARQDAVILTIKASADATACTTRLLAAVRAVIVEAMGRIVRRETEKARRAQATQEKLRAWMHHFYLLHEATACEILQPAVRAHLALIASEEPPEVVTLALVHTHITDSMRQLEAVAASEAGDFQIELGKLLTRWELHRPDALADRLLQEGVDHVRAGH